MVLEGPTSSDDADFLVRGIRSLWRSALIQPATAYATVPIHAFNYPVTTPVELLIYRDAASLASWQADGATDDNQDSMVHVIVSDRSITLVVDRHDSSLADAVRGILDALRRNRLQSRRAA